jgi:hypothetical protein
VIYGLSRYNKLLAGGHTLVSFELQHGMADGTAEDFVLAGVHLGSLCTDARYIAPTMVCFSFAIELHTKALLASCSIDPGKEHNLYKLYEKLPDDKKIWVVKMYGELVAKSGKEAFENELKEWSRVFMDVRYYHDRTKKDPPNFDFSNFIPNLAIAINNGYLQTEKHESFSFPYL